MFQAGFADPLIESGGDFGPHSRDETDAQAVVFDHRADALQKGFREIGLGSGSSHGKREKRRAAFLVRGEVAKKMMNLAPGLLAEDAFAVQPHEAAQEVLPQGGQVRAAHELVGEREAGKFDLFAGDAVGAQAVDGTVARGEVNDFRISRVERHPGAVDVHVRHHAVDAVAAVMAGAQGRHEEGGDQWRARGFQKVHEAPAQAFSDQPVERARLEVGG